MMPKGEAMFGQNYFKMPLESIGLLRDIPEIYSLPGPTEYIISDLQLDPQDEKNDIVMSHLWLKSLINRSYLILHSIIQTFNSNGQFFFTHSQLTRFNPAATHPSNRVNHSSPHTPHTPPQFRNQIFNQRQDLHLPVDQPIS